MIVHVLPGDSVAKEFENTGIDGDVIVCRECLVVGDVSGETLDEFWERRANFIMLEYAGDPIEYQEKVAYELQRLLDLPPETEINLWFEYELFCQTNMWFCLDLLRDSDVKIFRVQPINLSPDDVWQGFGKHDADGLVNSLDARTQFTIEDIQTGSRLWNAFRSRDFDKLGELGAYRSPCFPFLKEVCDAAVEIEGRPAEIVNEIRSSGLKEIEAIFPEFQKRAGVYGFGDAQVERLLERM